MGYKFIKTGDFVREELINSLRIQLLIKEFLIKKRNLELMCSVNGIQPNFVWLDEVCCHKNLMPNKTLAPIDINKREKTNKSIGEGDRFTVIHAGNQNGFIKN